MAVTREGTQLGRYLISLFGKPAVSNGSVLGWRLRG
jgi:hypothetical protein